MTINAISGELHIFNMNTKIKSNVTKYHEHMGKTPETRLPLIAKSIKRKEEKY